MHRMLVPAVVAGLTLALALGATEASDSPERFVVDSVSAPVLSVEEAAQTIEIVLVPDMEYQPVHPDAADSDNGTPAPEAPGPAGDESATP